MLWLIFMQNHVISDQLSQIMEISRDGKFSIDLAESIDLEIYKQSQISHPQQHPSLQFRKKSSPSSINSQSSA